MVDFDWLPLVLHELEEDGILKRGSKGLILSHGNEEKIDSLQYLRDTRISLIMVSDLHLIYGFGFCISPRFGLNKLVDRIVKIGGVLVTALNNSPSSNFQELPSNYKLRIFEN